MPVPPPAPAAAARPVAIVSACLLGRPSRYDGRHKLAPALRPLLEGRGYRILALCPEADAGLPTPRPPMDLRVGPDGTIRCLDIHGCDHTPLLADWIATILERLRPLAPALFVLKAKSPSCGLKKSPPGLFAAAAREAFPDARFLDEADLPPLPLPPSRENKG